MFKEIDVKEKANEFEARINKYWEENGIAKKSENFREGAPKYIFFEGPPTANGMPGIHHAISRTLKDTVCRYKTMKGFQVKRKAGWDTHGLPVEIEVQKQLGISDKKEIESFGIAEFNKKCRESVFKYEKEWREMTKMLGYWLDLDNAYITLTNEYIETVWWLLNQFWKKGMIYEDNKIVPFCPSCGTPLSSHEVAQGYREVEDPSVFIKFKAKDEENTYFLAWTTTPWTLISNMALVVHPEYKYVKVKTGGEYLILSKSRLNVLDDEYEIVEEFIGKELEGKEYEQLFPFTKPEKKAFFVALGDYVTLDDGTGVVHTAPAFGEDDYRIGKKYDLPFVRPVNEEGKFTDRITDWAGVFVKDADKDIIRTLKRNGALYKREQIKHTYPFCWRCDSPLIYFARKSWYIKTSAFKKQMIENNHQIEWFPKYIGEGRFGDWLENNIDWAISRNRFWGTPLNIWVCEKCGKLDSPESISDLREKGKFEDGSPIPENIELHRPFVDDIYFTCPECGGKMKRTPEVIDCWFDSGSMPFAQWHYPFENKDKFEKELFPADFIAEGIDQTRGWFYTLLAISTFITGKSSYKRCLVNDLVLDKNGKKMSKSKGNAVNVFDILNKYGADATRWFMLAVSPPWTPTKFDEEGIKEVTNKLFGTLKNVLSFFVTYANIDNYSREEYSVPVSERPEIDRWIVSRLNSVTQKVIENNDIFQLTRSVRLLQTFILDDVSNWYVRRIRKRCWISGMKKDKIAAYQTLYELLINIAKLIAPFAPFFAEDIYTNLTGEESVHLQDYPSSNSEFIDVVLENDMKSIIEIVSLARAARNEAQIKVRQPLKTLYVQEKFRDVVGKMKALIVEEINVTNIDFVTSKEDFIDYEVKANFKVLGPKYGKHMPHIVSALKNLDANHIVAEIRQTGVYHLEIDNIEIKFDEEGLDIFENSKENSVFNGNGETFVVLDTQIDAELLQQGYARELVNKIQFMRKENAFEIVDRIKVEFFSEEMEIKKTLEIFGEYIKSETLTTDLVENVDTDKMKKWDINGKEVYLRVSVIRS